MRLKRLEIRGFKTFANPLELEFPSPITAIVGPNGSGKSNIADAVRWVLGEQGLRAIRCKRTEDVIFAGGTGRPQLGMAEVVLTLDNETGWLDVPFAEVSLTRRAYRSGDNEYYLNGSRVRLRDLADLVLKATLGPDSYAVIGQGMVDLALSQRPEERRSLFEEAADIKRHYLKVKEARDKLAATESNMQRVSDLAAELAPRLATLEKQAERARRRQALSDQLRGLLRRWYGHQWRLALARLAAAEAEERGVSAHLRELEAASEKLAEESSVLVADRALASEQLALLSTAAAELAEQVERAQLELAVGRERQAALAERRREIERRLGEIDLGQQRAARRLAATAEATAALAQRKAELEARAAEMARAAAAYHAKREELLRRVGDAQARLDRTTEAWAATMAAAARAVEQVKAAQRQQEDSRRAHAETERRAAVAQGEAEAAEEREAALIEQARAAAAALSQQEGVAAQAEAKLASARAEIDRLGERRQSMQARLSLLRRWQQDLSGYHGGVRAVLQAARGERAARLEGVVGIVADLLRVPPELETAIEVALGGRLQDVVVERWPQAEAAIAHLKHTRAGRATFLPLDTIRPPAPARPPAGPGVLGLACELVAHDPAYAGLARHLLGRTLVVEDLPTARRVLADCPPGWQIVTPAGEVVRASGAVTGGTLGTQSAGLLAQQRELRELPARLATIDQQVATAEGNASRLAAEAREARAAAGELVRREREAVAARQRAEAELAARRRELERARREVAQAATAVRATDEARRGADQREARTRQDLDTLTEQRDQARALVEELRERVAAFESADGETAQRQAEARAAVAETEREEGRLLREGAEGREEIDRLRRATREAREEMAEMERQSARLAESLETTEQLAEGLACQRERIQADEERHRARATAIETELAQIEQRRQELHRRRAALGTNYAAASAAARTAQADLAALRERIGGDLSPEEEGSTRQIRLPWEEETAPEDAEELGNPEQLRRQIDQSRAQLRSLSAVSPEAVRDYEEMSERYRYLTSQHADLQQAARSLRQAIADLERAMRRQFDRTFAAIAAEFRQCFTTLFGGGTARLVLTKPDDVLGAGIEIVAQPPGKRWQNLALLSGGERALTGVALLFAILRVKPAPFCVLDEVDAALDDSNVLRFANMLESLASRTQFVVITHNRGTMQVAGSLFGIAIGQDGVSRLVSLRLDEMSEAEAAAAGVR